MTANIRTDSIQSPHADNGTRTAGSRLRLGDIFRVGAAGPRARKLRTALSALGISIEAGSGFGAGDSELPATAVGAVERIPTVTEASAVWDVDTDVYRTEYIDEGETGGVTVAGTDTNLLDTLNGTVAEGVFLNEVTSDYPAAILGSIAAERLGIRNLDQPTYVLIGDQYVEVVGILDEFPLAADLDRSVMIGQEAAETFYDADDAPAVIYARVVDGSIDETRAVLPATTDPQNPEEITVSRPSDALEAQAAADDALTTLFLGLGAVALLVGGIGIANVMVIAVIERRGEIGLRRALGATRAHIRRQFLTEAVILSILGGAAGVVIGIVVTYVYAASQSWRVIIPTQAAVGGLAAAVLIGAIAGLYPAIRAARLAPTEALRA